MFNLSAYCASKAYFLKCIIIVFNHATHGSDFFSTPLQTSDYALQKNLIL